MLRGWSSRSKRDKSLTRFTAELLKIISKISERSSTNVRMPATDLERGRPTREFRAQSPPHTAVNSNAQQRTHSSDSTSHTAVNSNAQQHTRSSGTTSHSGNAAVHINTSTHTWIHDSPILQLPTVSHLQTPRTSSAHIFDYSSKKGKRQK